ncbi:MAG: phosphoribosylamine--glycine ligase [Haloquadratum walsbyi J07HQW1]|jgi:phosphoribosylamine--glycine ligase (EC 6.3.4.13)|uniref:Phosphoribosylamine--glycine ligase n=1 Tax=Haloquadratum walsbyi J07HQW1 TaxID=1238424 RepID=U1PJS4_9EURY|nr:MAG: phosphoribosylamine--glycine ligase [Haloquadratum walsbyi J07HQW1]
MGNTESVLLIGGGGREHAIAQALTADARCRLYACAENRNPGIAALSADFNSISATSVDAIVEYATTDPVDADLAIIGPESALEAGVADALDAAGVYTFGPTAETARIETDKAFQRQFMQSESIPGCPDFAVFEEIEAACAYIDETEHDLAVKPAGLTGGKGVRVIGDQVTESEAKSYLRESEYEQIVLEERLVGEEFTVQAFVANGELRITPAIQDHKRAYEGDTGPNTGGMGSYSDTTQTLPFMSAEEYTDAVAILEATVEALPAYKGVLYGQFMLTSDGPRVIEFNARFGDPEAMNTLPILETSLLDIMRAAQHDESLPALSFSNQATVCKYAVPEGYPTDPHSGTKITVDEESAESVRVYYASVDSREDGLYTTTSRAFAVVGIADSIATAESQAETALSTVADGLRVRHDVGTPSLLQRRIEHMDAIREE